MPVKREWCSSVSQTKDFGNKRSFCQISHSKTGLSGSDFPDC
ncbi:hypothetical protein QUB16_08065 [Microcoleus sp. D3_18a_C4]